MKRSFLTACLIGLLAAGHAFADGPSLKGKFVLEGTIPPVKELGATAKEKADCGDPNLKVLDESVVINPTNKGWANIIVYLSPAPGGKKPPLPAGHKAAEAAAIVFDNKMLRFEPHVLVVEAGQKVEITNSDKIGHNTKIDFTGIANKSTNDALPAGAKIPRTFDKEERIPAQVSCSIHPYMKSYLLVRENPYFAVSDKDGNFEIKNLPDGDWQFQVWQEKCGYVTDVKVGGKATKWAKGKFSQKVAGKEIDLGSILVPASNIKKD